MKNNTQMKTYKDALLEKGRRAAADSRFLLRPTWIFTAIYLVAVSAILRANFFYHDDIQRACWGWPNWGFSRHVSNGLSKFLHAGSYLTDISPLPQLLAVLIIAFTSVLCIHLITGSKKIGFWQIIAAVPIGLSPYFLECLSFKFDAPYMALSVLFSVLPLLWCNASRYLYVLSTAVCTVAMSSSYQASSGIFPMLVVILGVCRWTSGEKLWQVMRFYLISAVGFLAGLLLYRQFFMEELNAYATTAMPPLAELLPSAIANYKRYIVHFLQGFTLPWLVTAFVICVCFLVTVVRASKRNKLLTLLVTGFSMIIMFLLAFGVYPFLVEPLFYPRAMYGIGCFLAFLGIWAVSAVPKGYLTKIACFGLSWAFFVFALTFGNALDVQARYTDFRISEVVDDLAACETLASEEPVTLQITGSIGYAPGLESMITAFPMIEKLVPVTFRGDGWWGEFGIRYYYGLPEFRFAETYDPPEEELPLVIDQYYHTIRADEDYIWIDLH